MSLEDFENEIRALEREGAAVASAASGIEETQRGTRLRTLSLAQEVARRLSTAAVPTSRGHDGWLLFDESYTRRRDQAYERAAFIGLAELLPEREALPAWKVLEPSGPALLVPRGPTRRAFVLLERSGTLFERVYDVAYSTSNFMADGHYQGETPHPERDISSRSIDESVGPLTLNDEGLQRLMLQLLISLGLQGNGESEWRGRARVLRDGYLNDERRRAAAERQSQINIDHARERIKGFPSSNVPPSPLDLRLLVTAMRTPTLEDEVMVSGWRKLTKYIPFQWELVEVREGFLGRWKEVSRLPLWPYWIDADGRMWKETGGFHRLRSGGSNYVALVKGERFAPRVEVRSARREAWVDRPARLLSDVSETMTATGTHILQALSGLPDLGWESGS